MLASLDYSKALLITLLVPLDLRLPIRGVQSTTSGRMGALVAIGVFGCQRQSSRSQERWTPQRQNRRCGEHFGPTPSRIRREPIHSAVSGSVRISAHQYRSNPDTVRQ